MKKVSPYERMMVEVISRINKEIAHRVLGFYKFKERKFRNQIIHPTEHSKATVNSLDGHMLDFRDTLREAGLFDLRYQGSTYTWTNKRPCNPIAKKLDRLLVNDQWLAVLPNSQASFSAHDHSDHTPCLLNLNLPLPSSGSKPFKFLNYLTTHPNFIQLVETAWNQAGARAWNLSHFCAKLKSLKQPLKSLNRDNFSNIQKRVSETNDLLNLVQVQAMANPTPLLFQQEKDLMLKWNFLKGIEEEFLRQKSRISWLKGGDHNSAFFHRMVASRNSYNALRSLTRADGTTTSNPKEMASIAVQHFQEILAPSHLSTMPSSSVWFQDLHHYHCSDFQQQFMIHMPPQEEIVKVIKKLNPNKAPGPDGLTTGFFHAAWETVGSEMISSISHFFTTGFLPTSTNSTILALIPKKPGATSITDFRPISCCNTIYKAISKLLVVRLKPMLHDLILPNQTAFIKGRLLVENTILAGEIIKGYHRNNGPPRITIKVDLAKAFDTVDWGFLLNCLRNINVPNQFIRWIEASVCTPSYSVGFNGSIHGYFKGRRGLRQGDPLSPYLFVIVMNCLSHMLNKAAEEGKIGYHHQCEATRITHLCFADDLLIFTDGSLNSVLIILQILQEFKARSGLGINISKTSFVAAGLSTTDQDRITEATGISLATLPFHYLGLPLGSKKLSMMDCSPLIEKIKGRISTWSAKSLSYAGRLQLIKSVIGGITNFWSTAFVLPKRCVSAINSLCSAFLWKGKAENKKGARVAWAAISVPKEEGGLGLKDLITWNKASVLKLIWLIFFRRQSLWVAWLTNSVLGGNLHRFWTVKPQQRNSWLSNKLLKWRDLLFPFIKTTVGNGRHTSFWSSNWSPFGRLSEYIDSESPLTTGIPARATLFDLWNGSNWNLPPARSNRLVEVQAFMSTITLSAYEDNYIWTANVNNSIIYSTGNMYDLLRIHLPTVTWHTLVWAS